MNAVLLNKIIQNKRLALKEMPNNPSEIKDLMMLAFSSDRFSAVTSWLKVKEVQDIVRQVAKENSDYVFKWGASARCWVLMNADLNQEKKQRLGVSILAENDLDLGNVLNLMDWAKKSSDQSVFFESLRAKLSYFISALIEKAIPELDPKLYDSEDKIINQVELLVQNSNIQSQIDLLFERNPSGIFSVLEGASADWYGNDKTPAQFVASHHKSAFTLKMTMQNQALAHLTQLYKQKYLDKKLIQNDSPDIIKQKIRL